jgi:hypothetical protein
MRSAIPSMPSQVLADAEVARVRHGQAVTARSNAPEVALVDERGELVALAERDNGWVHPSVVLHHES